MRIMSAVNPAMIAWARKIKGYSIEDLAARMKKDPAKIESWENGESSPSYASLERLADNLKIPLAIFLFPEPPKIDGPINKFRRLPHYELLRLSPDTLQKIQMGMAYQESLTELILDYPRKEIFREIEPERLSITKVADMTREYLGISIKKQFSFSSTEQAFKGWRHAIESAGIFTFKDSFDDHFISGFSLMHPRFPIIFINNSNSFARQIFTAIHELGHILFGVNGITDIDETYMEYMNRDDRALEVKCNLFAAEVLVPDYAFNKDVDRFNTEGLDIIPEIAEQYRVSREVILRRLLDRGFISSDYYQAKASEWNEDFFRSKSRKSRGNYYLTKMTYLGEGFAQLAFNNYNSGRLSRAELASHLNVKAQNVDKLEKYIRW
jgi:Zn-dependent peptidase ImmA (M78 family)